MQKWEYVTISYDWDEEAGKFYWQDTGEYVDDIESTKKRLDALGQDGWELVSVVSLPRLGEAEVIAYYLKRPVT